jgi:hypothetical protein
VPGRDPTHWLHRLTADEWLAAAATELGHCEETLARRAVRPGVTHPRRAGGMAWTAVLALVEDPRFGRSYMEHLVALAGAGDETAPAEVRAAAQQLRATAPAPPELITLGKPDLRPLEEARRIVTFAAARVAALQAKPD